MVVDIHPSTHPPLPPTTEDERLSWLRLLRSRRVGIATFYRLLSEHGSADAALAALPAVAAEAGLTDYHVATEAMAVSEMKAARKARARLICIGTSEYPAQLLDLSDPPPLLWVIGQAPALTKPMIALAGARNASSLGLRMARQMAAELSEAGYIVVSGLARGIDAAAHEASVDRGTVAVMAGGADSIYPAENAALAQRIPETGARISEMAMGHQPQARHFPRRNRLISGLAQALIVVEAAAKSGSLITARAALDQGRDVLAVPGHPFDSRAAGGNMLIRDGATLVRSAADVLEALPPLPAPVPAQGEFHLAEAAASAPVAPRARRSLREVAALHRDILDRLSPSPVAEDQLIRDVHRAAPLVSEGVTQLELLGRVRRQAGGLLARISGSD
ncbi:DNA-processing protein DprA [Pseudooceanicola sp. C21-150M6]|uniref:DNA-processing protein DprA n=1 Tax=Pseudooceanicola sp. C21-150M6 TaxID=3434355 RepID=UPI003D7F536C